MELPNIGLPPHLIVSNKLFVLFILNLNFSLDTMTMESTICSPIDSDAGPRIHWHGILPSAMSLAGSVTRPGWDWESDRWISLTNTAVVCQKRRQNKAWMKFECFDRYIFGVHSFLRIHFLHMAYYRWGLCSVVFNLISSPRCSIWTLNDGSIRSHPSFPLNHLPDSEPCGDPSSRFNDHGSTWHREIYHHQFQVQKRCLSCRRQLVFWSSWRLAKKSSRRNGEIQFIVRQYSNWSSTDHLIQWNIVLLSNGNYTIMNYGYSSYATCEIIDKPDVGHCIVGGNSDHQQQWKIIEHGNSYVYVYVCDYDHYFISINTLDVNLGFAPLRTDMYIGISPMGKVVLPSVTIF